MVFSTVCVCVCVGGGGGGNLHHRHSNGPLEHRMSVIVYGTHHLNNCHHNIYPLVLCGASYGTHLKGVFGQLPLYHHCSRPLGYRVELHMRPAWTSVWGCFHTIVTTSDPSGIMRLPMGPTWKIFFGQLLYSCGHSGIVWVPILVHVITNGQLPQPT